MTQQDPSGGREWRPYEIATPIVRDTSSTMPPPLPPGLEASPYAAPRTSLHGHGRAHASTQDFVLASLPARLGAALIDIGLWALPLLFVFKTMMHMYRMKMLGLPTTGVSMSGFGLIAIFWIALAVWNIVWMAQHAQTVGKRVVGIRVVRSDGSPVGFWRLLLLRGAAMNVLCNLVGRVVPLASTVLWLVDTLFIIGDDRRTLHDRIADTIVVDA